MAGDIEYHDAMIAVLEFIWGEGFMAPGGKGNIANMVNGIDLQDKHVLDIGCGLGGPACILASDYGASVVGIDIESHLIDLARQRADKLGLNSQTEFKLVKPGKLTFADAMFDLVISSGAFTQIKDKQNIFQECLRVLKPGGVLSCYDWMKSAGEYSEDMLYWFKMEGLTYEMETPERHEQILAAAGFINIEINDRSDWYRNKAREEYEKMKNELYTEMVNLLGQADADHFVEDWRAMVVVCEKGEMRQVYCRAQKPA